MTTVLQAKRVSGLITCSELARRAGVSASTVSRLEWGLCRPSLITASRIAAALDMTVEELFPQEAAK